MFVWISEELRANKFTDWRKVRVIDLTQIIRDMRERSTDSALHISLQVYPRARNEDEFYMPFVLDLDGDPRVIWEQYMPRIRQILRNGGLEWTEYFSGSKGFHIITNEWGSNDPSVYANRLFAELINTEIGADLADTQIHRKKLLRCPGSFNFKGQRYKIKTEPDMTFLQILDAALKPKARREMHHGIPIPPGHEEASEFPLTEKPLLRALLSDAQATLELRRSQPKAKIKFDLTEVGKKATQEGRMPLEAPVCVQDLYANHIRLYGSRNRATMVLAAYLKTIGMPLERAESLLCEWAERCPAHLTQADPRRIESSTKSCVRAVYRSEKYGFACPFILALGSEANPIECRRAACSVPDELQKMTVPPSARLSELSDVSIKGKRIEVPGIVISLGVEDYWIPHEVEVVCAEPGSKDHCNMCELNYRTFKVTVSSTTNLALKFIAAPPAKARDILAEYLNIAKCEKITPRVRSYSFAYFASVAEDPDFTVQSSVQERPRMMIILNENVSAGRSYYLRGQVHQHPKTSAIRFISDEVRSRERLLDKPPSDEEMKVLEQLRVPPDYESIRERWSLIAEDLERITGIRRRKEMLMAMDLTYHSPLHIVLGDDMYRGWMQIYIIGDTAQGKSVAADRLMRFYGFGARISGEMATRTGLVYSVQDLGDGYNIIWGLLPLNDRGLVVIDEAQALSQDDFAQMSDLRESGTVTVERVRRGRTLARVRLIFIANPKRSAGLRAYPFPIEALLETLKEPADIRRLDFAVALLRGVVPPSEINAFYDRAPKFLDPIVASTLIHFAWTLPPERIRFSKDAVEALSKYSGILQEVYSSAIPLVSPDQRVKLARCSAALAVRMFNYHGKEIIVREGHVQAVAEFINEVYAGELRYFDYSATVQAEKLSDSEYANIRNDYQVVFRDSIFTLQSGEFARKLLLNPKFSQQNISDLLGVELRDARRLISFMLKYELVKRSRPYGYELTNRGVEFFRRYRDELEAPEFQGILD